MRLAFGIIIMQFVCVVALVSCIFLLVDKKQSICHEAAEKQLAKADAFYVLEACK